MPRWWGERNSSRSLVTCNWLAWGITPRPFRDCDLTAGWWVFTTSAKIFERGEIGGGKLGTPTNRNLVGGRSNALQPGIHRRQMKVKRRMKGPSPCVVRVATKMGIVERRAAASAFARVVERFSSRSVRSWGVDRLAGQRVYHPATASPLSFSTSRFRSAYDRPSQVPPSEAKQLEPSLLREFKPF